MAAGRTDCARLGGAVLSMWAIPEPASACHPPCIDVVLFIRALCFPLLFREPSPIASASTSKPHRCTRTLHRPRPFQHLILFMRAREGAAQILLTATEDRRAGSLHYP